MSAGEGTKRQLYELPETRVCPCCGARFGKCHHSMAFAESRTVELMPPKCGRTGHDGVPWDEAELARLRSYRARGMTNTQIADRLNRSRNSINGMVFRLGLERGVTC